jgi:uncharacterized protein
LRQPLDANQEKCNTILMYIPRYYSDKLSSFVKPNKVLVIYGPRQTGKTTLVNKYLEGLSQKTRVYRGSGENLELKTVLESQEFSKIIPFFQGYNLVFVDEAQKIENVGLSLKIIVDQIPGIKVIATGSSSFSLSNKVGEPLVGRQTVLTLFPFAVLELKSGFGSAYPFENLENLLVFGGYPEVIKSPSRDEKISYLIQLRDSYLLRDLLELENIKNSKKIFDLLRLIAFQIGREVSLQELGNQLAMSKNSVERYLELLEKSFVIINLRGFSRNLRKEISKTSRYYFYDNGVLNAIIGNFNYLNTRNDIGQLWENFLFTERLKKQAYYRQFANNYFWRTWDQKEIDLVEEREGKLYGYEFKYSKKKYSKPKLFLKTYPKAQIELINRENYIDFVS